VILRFAVGEVECWFCGHGKLVVSIVAVARQTANALFRRVKDISAVCVRCVAGCRAMTGVQSPIRRSASPAILVDRIAADGNGLLYRVDTGAVFFSTEIAGHDGPYCFKYVQIMNAFKRFDLRALFDLRSKGATVQRL